MSLQSVAGFWLCAVVFGCASSNKSAPPTNKTETASRVESAPPAVATEVQCPEGSHWDGQACIGDLKCPDGSHIEESRCVADSVEAPSLPTSAEPPPPPPPEASADASSGVSPTARDPRKMAKMPRARTLLVTEIQALESLFAATPKGSVDRVLILRRLAEGYVELEYAAQHDATAQGAKLVSAARKKAIQDYTQVEKEYPTYQRLDEVLYYAGYEYERGGDLPNAKAKYRALVQRFPGSSFVARVPRSIRGKAF